MHVVSWEPGRRAVHRYGTGPPGPRITLVDRGTGPRPDGAWPRRGVMQS
jgi:hypothetical protein